MFDLIPIWLALVLIACAFVAGMVARFHAGKWNAVKDRQDRDKLGVG